MMVTIEISQEDFDLLSALGKPTDVLVTLVDHAVQGICRPGAWEREWIAQAFDLTEVENESQIF